MDGTNIIIMCCLQRPPGVMSVLDDICHQMHGQSEGADMKLLEVRRGAKNAVNAVFCIASMGVLRAFQTLWLVVAGKLG